MNTLFNTVANKSVFGRGKSLLGLGMLAASGVAVFGQFQSATASVTASHDWVFNSSYASGSYNYTADSVTGSQSYAATLENTVAISNGQAALTNSGSGGGAGKNYISLPVSAFQATANTGVTMEEWFTANTNEAHAQNLSLNNDTVGSPAPTADSIITGPGATTGQYMFMTQDAGGYGSRGAMSPGGYTNEVGVNSLGTGGAPVAGTSNPANYYLSWEPNGQPLQHMVTVVMTPVVGSNDGTITYYVDGVQQGSSNFTATDNWTTLAAGFTNAWIGRSAFAGDALFNGTVKEFRLYSSALTTTQVQADYATSVPEPASLALFGVAGASLLLIRRRRAAV